MNPITRWFRSYGLMVTWEFRTLRMVLPLAFVVQTMISSGLILGLGFFLRDITSTEAQFLAVGVTVVSMVTLGMVMAPQLIASQKQSGTYEYLLSLPVPRTTLIAAGLTVHSLIALPGAAVALLIAWCRYDIALSVSPVVIPAVLLTLTTAVSIGFALAHAIPNPMVTSLVANALIFVILFYAPINFPPERLPAWLASIHEVLPFVHSANLMRAGLTEGLASSVGVSFAVLAGWALASWSVTAWVVGRRP
jgi:ABC-2 type transport system permease protein